MTQEERIRDIALQINTIRDILRSLELGLNEIAEDIKEDAKRRKTKVTIDGTLRTLQEGL